VMPTGAPAREEVRHALCVAVSCAVCASIAVFSNSILMCERLRRARGCGPLRTARNIHISYVSDTTVEW